MRYLGADSGGLVGLEGLVNVLAGQIERRVVSKDRGEKVRTNSLRLIKF